MSHKAPLIDLCAGDYVSMTHPGFTNAIKDRINHATSFCPACGVYIRLDSDLNSYRILMEQTCQLICVHCKRAEDHHAGQRCLFQPTKFEALLFKVSFLKRKSDL